MKSNYHIKEDQNLLVICEVLEYDNIIMKRLSMFKKTNDININNYIHIYEDKTCYSLKNKKYVVNGKLKHTDLYQLINNIISNIINDSNNLYLHSSVVEKNGNGMLILGDFNSGKTTLSICLQERGYQILSADQTWIENNNNKIVMKLGSKYMEYNSAYEILDSNSDLCSIKCIVLLSNSIGKENNFYIENNKYRNIKNITKYATWSTSNVLMTGYFELHLNKVEIQKFVEKINIPVICVWGDISGIIKTLEEIEL